MLNRRYRLVWIFLAFLVFGVGCKDNTPPIETGGDSAGPEDPLFCIQEGDFITAALGLNPEIAYTLEQSNGTTLAMEGARVEFPYDGGPIELAVLLTTSGSYLSAVTVEQSLEVFRTSDHLRLIAVGRRDPFVLYDCERDK